MRPRYALLFAVVLTSVVLAGCTALPGTEPPSTTTTMVDSTVAPSDLSDSTAKERALNTEEAYLSARLRNASCLRSWGTAPTTGTANATVVNRTSEGVIVEAHHPYSYATNSSHADGLSHARYLITPTNSTRLSGNQIEPC